MNRIIKNGLNPLYRLTTQNLSTKPSPIITRSSHFLYKPTRFAWHQFQNNRFYSIPGAPLNFDLKQLTKDVIIYKYDNPRYFKLLNIFAYVQFIFWSCMAEFNFRTLRNTPVDENADDYENLPFYKRWNFGSDKFKLSMSLLCIGIGKILILE